MWAGGRARGKHYDFFQNATISGGRGGGGGYYGGAGFSSPSAPTHPGSSTSHSGNHNHDHYNSTSGFTPVPNPVAVVTPGTAVEDFGGSGGGSSSPFASNSAAMAPTAQALAAAAATVAVEAEAAVAMAADDRNTRFAHDRTAVSGGGTANHAGMTTAGSSGMYGVSGFALSCPSSPVTQLPPSDSCPSVAVPLLRSGCANVSGLDFGCGANNGGGNGDATQQQQQQLRDQTLYQSPIVRGAMAGEGGGGTGGTEGATPASSRDWLVVPMTPTSQDATGRRDSRPHHPAYELDLQQPQQQQLDGGGRLLPCNTGGQQQYQVTTPLARQQQQQQPEWFPENSTSLHSGVISSSSDDFLMAAAASAAANDVPGAAATAAVPPPTPGAAGGGGGTTGPRHVREASIDFALDEVSSLGGEMVFDNRDLYAMTTAATSPRAIAASGNVTDGGGGSGGGGGGGCKTGVDNTGSRKNAQDAALGEMMTAGGRLQGDCGLGVGVDFILGPGSRSSRSVGGSSNDHNTVRASAAAEVMQNSSPWNISTTHAPMFLSAGCT
ncbi:unnamed protein product [Scytosiphon promiscuus]